MRRVSDGYTIIEVMIFLAISVVIAGAAMNLISGKQEQTSFNQKMRDTQSKLQDWINDVSTGVTGGNPDAQTCTPQTINGSNRPVVQNVPPSGTYSPVCTFLGKAVQFTDSGTNSGTLYVYSVFGCRLVGCSPNGALPATTLDASPEPAIGQMGVDLTESFDLSPATVSQVCGFAQGQSMASCPASSSHLIGFMNSFNTGGGGNPAATGSENLNAYIYNLNGNPGKNSSAVQQCIEGYGSSCSLTALSPNPPPLSEYCFLMTDGHNTAQILINSSGGLGASVHLNYKSSCP